MKGWLKGGLIGAGIGILIQLIILEWGHPIYFGFLSFPTYGLFAGKEIGSSFFHFICITTTSIYFFLIGALIGYTIQKIKSKNPASFPQSQ